MSNTKKIGIFIYKYSLCNSPSIINLGTELAKYNFTVDYFTYESVVDNIKFNSSKIRIFSLDGAFSNLNLTTFLRKLIPVRFRQSLANIYYSIKGPRFLYEKRMTIVEKEMRTTLKHLIGATKDIIEDEQYRCFIGVEPGGLMWASEMVKNRNVPIIYYNLELGMWEDYDSDIIWNILNKYERLLNRYAVATITQDNERARIIANRNEIPLSSILTVPVCASGPAYYRKTDWLRKKFGLSQNDKIVLYAGYITDWAMCIEMAKAASEWPDGIFLIFHSHSLLDKRYIRKLKKYLGKKVMLSLDSVPYEDLPAVLASADIGIALYKDLGCNFTLTGSASGKIAHYVKCGLPVISNNYPSIKKVIEGFDCGVCVETSGEINTAVEKILGDYVTMRKNAFRCYEERFMFSKQFGKVMDLIKGFENNGS